MAEKVPGPPIIDSSLEGLKRWQLERNIHQNFFNRGSRYPPFSIEPLPLSNQRTSKPMTAEERFLRKQWLNDQIFAPDEPRYVPEIRSKNSIRRFYRKPWDFIERGMAKIIGTRKAHVIRIIAPKYMLAYVSVLFLYYQTVYNSNTWERSSGPRMRGRRRIISDEEGVVRPEVPIFGDARFSEREFRNN